MNQRPGKKLYKNVQLYIYKGYYLYLLLMSLRFQYLCVKPYLYSSVLRAVLKITYLHELIYLHIFKIQLLRKKDSH